MEGGQRQSGTNENHVAIRPVNRHSLLNEEIGFFLLSGGKTCRSTLVLLERKGGMGRSRLSP
jgi:hypothetical protein